MRNFCYMAPPVMVDHLLDAMGIGLLLLLAASDDLELRGATFGLLRNVIFGDTDRMKMYLTLIGTCL